LTAAVYQPLEQATPPHAIDEPGAVGSTWISWLWNWLSTCWDAALAALPAKLDDEPLPPLAA